MSAPNVIANGNISPSRFVMPDTSTPDNNSVLQATANATIFGISQAGGREPPLPSVSTIYAAQAGDPVKVLGIGDIGHLEIVATVAAGDELISDASGKGTPRASGGTTNQNVGAIALEAGGAGALIRVQVQRYVVRPT